MSICICRKHLKEAVQEGLDESIVPEMIQRSEDENEKAIRLMMMQQAQLIAEMEKAYAEEDAEVHIISS